MTRIRTTKQATALRRKVAAIQERKAQDAVLTGWTILALENHCRGCRERARAFLATREQINRDERGS